MLEFIPTLIFFFGMGFGVVAMVKEMEIAKTKGVKESAESSRWCAIFFILASISLRLSMFPNG